jgi:hypothetical protein
VIVSHSRCATKGLVFMGRSVIKALVLNGVTHAETDGALVGDDPSMDIRY